MRWRRKGNEICAKSLWQEKVWAVPTTARGTHYFSVNSDKVGIQLKSEGVDSHQIRQGFEGHHKKLAFIEHKLSTVKGHCRVIRRTLKPSLGLMRKNVVTLMGTDGRNQCHMLHGFTSTELWMYSFKLLWWEVTETQFKEFKKKEHIRLYNWEVKVEGVYNYVRHSQTQMIILSELHPSLCHLNFLTTFWLYHEVSCPLQRVTKMTHGSPSFVLSLKLTLLRCQYHLSWYSWQKSQKRLWLVQPGSHPTWVRMMSVSQKS